MSNNDSIKRSTVLGTLIANFIVGNLTKEALELFTQEINDIPADERLECMGKYIEYLEQQLEVATGVRVECLREIYNDILRQVLTKEDEPDEGDMV